MDWVWEDVFLDDGSLAACQLGSQPFHKSSQPSLLPTLHQQALDSYNECGSFVRRLSNYVCNCGLWRKFSCIAVIAVFSGEKEQNGLTFISEGDKKENSHLWPPA